MERIKEIEINKIRLENLKKDLNLLQNKGYKIVDVSEDKMYIAIKGILMDYKEMNAVYILSYEDFKENGLFLRLEY